MRLIALLISLSSFLSSAEISFPALNGAWHANIAGNTYAIKISASDDSTVTMELKTKVNGLVGAEDVERGSVILDGAKLNFHVINDGKEVRVRVYEVLALEGNQMRLLWDNPPIEGGFVFTRDEP
jgi:hypothetical protein